MKSPVIVICLALLALATSARAQWVKINSPSGGPVKSLLMDLDGNLFAGTERGVYLSTDRAETWTWRSSLQPRKDAFAVDSSGALFAGEKGMWKSTDGGLSWQEVALAGQSILCLTVAPDNTVYAGVDGPDLRGVFRSAKTEIGWTSQSSGTDRGLNGVSFTGADTAIVVGDAGTILRTTDDGATWDIQPSGTTESLRCVSFADASTGTAVGENGAILRTTDGGATWESQVSGTTVNLRGVYFTTADTGTVVGYDGTILCTIDGGVTWRSQTSGTLEHLFGVFFTDARNGTAVGDRSTIVRTTDSGSTWESQPSGTIVNFRGVCFMDANTGAAVGDNFGGPMLLWTSDGGATWTDQKIGITIGPTATLYDVCFTDANTGTAVGGYWQGGAVIIRTTDGGTTWKNLPGGTTEFLYAVDFVNDTCGIAVGRNGTILHTTPDGEMLWLPHGLSGQRVGHLLLSERHGLLATVGWSSVYCGSTVDTSWNLIGSTSSRPHTFVEDTAGNLYIGLEVRGVDCSTDGGATWHRTGLGSPYTVTSLASLPNGQVYAGAYPLDPSIDGGVYRTTDAGVSWDSLGLEDWYVHTVFASNESDIFLGSNRGVFRSFNGGDSWEVASEGITAAENFALLCIDQSTVFAGTGAGLYRSTDDGESWHESGQGILPHFVTSLACDRSGNLFAGNMVFSPKGGIFKSTDRGETWRCTTRDSIEGMYVGINAIEVTQSNALVAGVSKGGPEPIWVVRSEDGGETWSRASAPRSFQAIASDSGGYLYGATWGDGVLRSVDDGLTWTYTGPGLHSPWICCVAAKDTLEVFAGGSGGVSRSTNAGDSWNIVTGPLGSITVTALAVDINGDILIATWDKEIYRSTDDGESWTMDTIWIPNTSQATCVPSGKQSAGTSTEWIFAFARREDRMFAADTLGTFFRYNRPTSDVGISGDVVPVSVRLCQNYPNPFNPNTSIEYTLPHAGYATLRVYNILGEEVATLADEGHTAGSFKATWDASGLPSGVYCYRLTAGEYVQTRKMVLIK